MKASWLVLIGALAFAACTPDFAERGDAPVILRITKITGSSGGGGAGSGIGDVLNSDVVPVFNDNASITVELIAKNPNVGTGPTLAGRFNDVLVESYEVRYVRTDGRNQEGVDVPYRITGPVATQVGLGPATTFSIVVVRHQAKLEPPLRNLASVIVNQAGTFQLSGPGVLTTIAEITIFGHTTAGKAVSAKGSLQINFANFESSTPTG